MPKRVHRKKESSGTVAIRQEAQRARNYFKGSPHQMMRFADMLHAKAQNVVDIGYIRTLLFPELYNADIPQPLSSQSYCRFTDKREFTIGSAGQGMAIFYPKINVGPCLFIRTGQDIANNNTFQLGAGQTDWKGYCLQNYGRYFNASALVSASIQIQYVGQAQNAQGYMTGSQLYNQDPRDINQQVIEDGQYKTTQLPQHGIRMVYMPRGIDDFTYYPVLDKGIGQTFKARNAGSKNDGDAFSLHTNASGDLAAQVNTIKTFLTSNDANAVATLWPQGFADASSNTTICRTMQINAEADAIVIYWKGLFSSADDLRIDVTRKFNGFPKSEFRDVVDVIKPRKSFDPKKTVDVVAELQYNIPNLLSHGLNEMDRVSEKISEFLPNVGHMYNEGMLKEGTSLGAFADQLQAISGNEGNTTFIGQIE